VRVRVRARITPPQAYIFPAVGYAAVLANSREITDEVCGRVAQVAARA
jgi:malic enzyme